ncbi:MAG: type II toxin-antitoxin system VapC family toxin [Nostoc sp. DedQUE08]|uniref:type II toxin-antitoxin system VapC family toxin n=1 Tax=Nostoc sp. DedQUE08 TaxID=3075393 RepID=UPI002AD33E29|nr:type II toxin-antitoxin system VapC family toxin [Nostoc sp. DedQUE08]MDZ8068134.1 type II toxin-antitoxin system VapC family toxin [Nostoc sp. DedQUE08]
MQVLLDTHTLIWFFQGHQSFSDKMRLLIEDQNNEKLISIASVWEISIKQNIGKLSFGLPIKTFIEQQIALNDFNLLSINLDNIDVITTLPLQHRDPFDRILIAQAMVENIPIISADTAFDAYSITRLW